MQSHRIAIRLTVPCTNGLTHQLRNLAEDLYSAFGNKRLAVVENMDAATDTVWVSVQSKGKIRAACKIIETCLAQHLLDNRCEIVVEAAENS